MNMQVSSTSSDDCILGIDLGGTFVRVARVDGCEGEFFSAPTPASMEAEEVVRSLIRRALRGMNARCLGLSRAPALDEEGRISSWPSQPHWTGLPLMEWLQESAGTVVSADDGICATLWEHRSRARGPEAVTACVSIGTGLAIGLMRGAEILPTGDGADTLSHERFGMIDLECRCGKYGCLQTALSMQGLEQIKAQGKIEQLRRAFHEFACAIKARHQANLIVISGGGVDRFGPSCLRRMLMTSVLAAGVELEISSTPALSGMGGALLLAAAGQMENRPRWTRRVREFIQHESERLLAPMEAFAEPVSA
jgi:predicted NBD/HSP70 family sugar kinase